jgi:hypothetical protein
MLFFAIVWTIVIFVVHVLPQKAVNSIFSWISAIF